MHIPWEGADVKSFLAIVFLVVGAPAWAQADTDRAGILAAIDSWYGELSKLDDGYPYRVTANGFIDASPHFRYIDNGSAKLGPRLYTSLAATALKFEHEVTNIRLDASFAKVRVWERGFFYASSPPGTTYERGASTLFVMERHPTDGRWLILAHESSSVGIPSTMKTDPMPDLRELWEKRRESDPLDLSTP